jgi:hypothetical protein
MMIWITSRLVVRFGARLPLVVGLSATGAGLAVLTQVGTHSSYLTLILPGYLLMGVGAGLAFLREPRPRRVAVREVEVV